MNYLARSFYYFVNRCILIRVFDHAALRFNLLPQLLW
jgi:hypothetical protein